MHTTLQALTTTDTEHYELLLYMLEEIEKYGESNLPLPPNHPGHETGLSLNEVKKELIKRYQQLLQQQEEWLTARRLFFDYFHPLRVPVRHHFNRLKKHKC
jgi:hypothetical protein